MKERADREIEPVPIAVPTSDSAVSQADSGRHPSDELGRPLQLPPEMRPPTEEELAAVRAAEERRAQRLYAEVTGTQARLGNFEIWQRRMTKAAALVVAALLALVALFVFANTVQILAVLTAQPPAIRWTGYAGVIILLGILGYFLIRLLVFFYRLRVNQQVSKAQLRELSRRADLRDFAQRDKALAKKNLEVYLREYPLGGGDTIAGLDADVVTRLGHAKQSLLDRNQFASYDDWLAQFHQRFQAELDRAADTTVANWRNLVFAKTAISPWPQVDSLVVLYCSYGMVGDLCRIYNLRMTAPGIARLMALSLFNTFAAGQLEDMLDSEHAKSFLSNLAKGFDLQSIGEFANMFVPGSSIALRAIGKVTEVGAETVLPKAADGLANALLIRRLGTATISMLRPMES